MKHIVIIFAIFLILYNLKIKKIKNLDNKNILVMFSGGLDSTFSLYHLLKNTNANIYVHHIAFEDSSTKAVNEDIACNNLITHFKKIRDFKYSKSKYRLDIINLDKNTKSNRQDDLSVVLFQAMQICTINHSLNIDYIVISDLKYELLPEHINYFTFFIDIMHQYRWFSKKPEMLDVVEILYTDNPADTKLYNAIDSIYSNENVFTSENINKMSKNNFLYRIAKSIEVKNKMYKILPNYIYNNIVSCRHPINNKKCGTCLKCKLEKLYCNNF